MSYYFKGLERQVTIQETKMASALSFTKILITILAGTSTAKLTSTQTSYVAAAVVVAVAVVQRKVSLG